MASKLEASTQSAKKIAIGCIIVIVVVILFNIVSNMLKKPPPPYNPYPQFAARELGEIPNIEFMSLELAEDSHSDFQIATTDDNLPKLPTLVKVYTTKTPRQSLSAHDDAVTIAKSLGFHTNPEAISPTELKWTQGTKTFIVNKLYHTATLGTVYDKDSRALEPHEILPDPGIYINSARSYLKGAGLFPEDYEGGKSVATYLKLNSNFEFELSKSAQDTNFVRVDFFKKVESLGVTIPKDITEKQKEEIENMRLFTDLFTDNPNEGLIHIIIGGTGGLPDVYELQYIDWEFEKSSTYDLITVADAWEEVRNNKGYLMSLYRTTHHPFSPYTPIKVNSFLLTNVETVYYSSHEYLQYIQPIYKFTGIAKLDEEPDANFTIYYPALKRE
ncbi:hypothetical protein JW766_02090 [Candidatus Dojkabacteria bacterium]|nr:hypothetical protein [Candidatus Dojkabacteria bacterium]